MTPREADYVIRILRLRGGFMTLIRCADGEILRVLNVSNGRDLGDDFDYLLLNITPPVEGLEFDFIRVNDVVEITDEEGTILYRAAEA